MRYADAGVNISLAEQAKQRIRRLASRTFTNNVAGPLGGFGALFELNRRRWRQPVLVSSADGAGTKLKIAFAMNAHAVVGRDLVNHCINDILTLGAEPLFFLDYLGMGKMEPSVVEQLVGGMAGACRKVGCALIGGETAEMPGFYAPGEYDLAGFIVGAVERRRILGAKRVRAGDVLLALPSTGLHTNGYSLARKLVFEVAKLSPTSYVREIGNRIGDELLKPHRCYFQTLRQVVARGWISALAHITGGGIPGNLPRVLPPRTEALIELGSWPVPAIFRYLASIGRLERDELLRTFNLGVGMIVLVPPRTLGRVESALKRRGEKFYRIGSIVSAAGKPGVRYTGRLPL